MKYCMLFGFYLFAAVQVVAQPMPVPQYLMCGHIPIIDRLFLDKHIIHQKESPNLEQRSVEQYIKRLDSTKRYFLQADVDKVRQLMSGVFTQLKKQNCKALMDVQKIYVERLEARMNQAKKVLDKNFKFDPTTELVVDPDHRKYAKTVKELDAEQAKFMQFQVSNYLATDMKLDEAKQTVVRGYERMVRRVREMKEEEIYSNFIDSFARSLDPHSSFFSRESFQDFEIQMGLSLEGIGATLSSNDGFTVVEQLIPGGAAARSGQLKPKDKIIGVGQDGKPIENVIEMDLRDVVQRIRGPKNTKVKLTVLRKQEDKQVRLTVTLVRDKIDLKDEEAQLAYLDSNQLNLPAPAEKAGDKATAEKPGEKKDKVAEAAAPAKPDDKKNRKVAILRLPSFYADAKANGRSSAKDVKKLLKEAREKKVEGIVLDLSDNAGGSLEDAVKIAGLFFKTGNVVKQSSRDSGEERALKDSDPTVDWSGPLVVLTSRLSASASEIVAGTLKDYNRAVIVGGDHTFGKGSVQSVVPLPQGLGAIKVTVGMFFIPGGKSTQHEGVEADIPFPGALAKDDVGEKSLDYSLPPKKVKAFKSEDAYVKEGPEAWMQVKSEEIKALKTVADKRIAQDKDFQKIVQDLKDDKVKKVKTVKLSETIKEREKGSKKDKENGFNKSDEEKKKEYLGRADIKEAVNILADLLSLREGRKIAGPSTQAEKGS